MRVRVPTTVAIHALLVVECVVAQLAAQQTKKLIYESSNNCSGPSNSNHEWNKAAHNNKI